MSRRTRAEAGQAAPLEPKPHHGEGTFGVNHPYNRAPVHLARRLAQVLISAVGQATPADGLRNEFGLLVAISQNPGLDQKRLAASMVMDATTIGQLLDNLERKGHVRRAASPTDRRVNLIEVTAAGREVVETYRPKVLAAQDEVLAVLTEAEKRTMLELMARVVAANPQHDRPGGGRRPPRAQSD
jgi:DNA-binding MarR family transcriptional regulator